MRLQFRFVFVVFYLTAALICTVYIRSRDNQTFYKLYRCRSEQSRLKQQLANRQLRLESLINPATVSRILND